MQLNQFINYQSLIAGAILVASTQVQAGTMGPVEMPSWSGVYVSGQLGGAWGQGRYNFTNSNYYNTFVLNLSPFTPFNLDKNGFSGGGSIGYNYQFGSYVVGLENSFFATGLKTSIASPFFPLTDVFTNTTNSLGSIRAKVGYAPGKWLINFNGGLSMIRSHISFKSPAAFRNTPNSVTSHTAFSPYTWNAGFVLGVGIDRKITSHLSAGLGYEYNRANTTILASPIFAQGGLALTANGKLVVQNVMARITYHFNQV